MLLLTLSLASLLQSSTSGYPSCGACSACRGVPKKGGLSPTWLCLEMQGQLQGKWQEAAVIATSSKVMLDLPLSVTASRTMQGGLFCDNSICLIFISLLLPFSVFSYKTAFSGSPPFSSYCRTPVSLLPPSGWSHFFPSSSDTFLFSVPPSLSGVSRCPHINATCDKVSFSDPPSHLSALQLTSKSQERWIVALLGMEKCLSWVTQALDAVEKGSVLFQGGKAPSLPLTFADSVGLASTVSAECS